MITFYKVVLYTAISKIYFHKVREKKKTILFGTIIFFQLTNNIALHFKNDMMK